MRSRDSDAPGRDSAGGCERTGAGASPAPDGGVNEPRDSPDRAGDRTQDGGAECAKAGRADHGIGDHGRPLLADVHGDLRLRGQGHRRRNLLADLHAHLRLRGQGYRRRKVLTDVHADL